MGPSLIRSAGRSMKLFATLGVIALLTASVRATPPNPIVSSIFVPVEGDILELGTTNTVHLTGEIHVVTQVAFSDAGVPSVGIWANLVRVRGTSGVSGITYLGVGAGNVTWVGTNPGSPEIPAQTFELALVSLGTNPGLPEVPPSPVLEVSLHDLHFGVEDTNLGRLMTAEASFR
jgi:hypothetical protein